MAALHLLGLGSAPPGLYNDEASIGYNAWAIAHGGVDEHGAQLPLFFEAFGEYKSPVYIYTLAPLTWLGALSPELVRLPAACSGIAIAGLAGLLAFRLNSSRVAVALTLLSAGLEPWLWAESRVAFESIEMVLLLLLAVVALARRPAPRPGDFALAGLAIAMSVYTYSSARLFGALFAAAVLGVYVLGRRPRPRGWWWLIPPVGAGYLGLLAYQRLHPGALLARYGTISIGADGAGPPVLVGRFVGNYLEYISPPFLFVHGDANPRHHSGFGGMLSIAILPVLLIGVVLLVRRRRQPFAQLVLLGLLLAPVPAALTAEGIPHSLRASPMLPFLVATIAIGWAAVVPRVVARRRLAAAAGLLLVASYGGYLGDYATAYPGRSVLAWDTGQAPAIAEARRLAHRHRVLVSTNLDQPYIYALFVSRPDPTLYHRAGLAAAGVELALAGDVSGLAGPGDLVVLAPGDRPPRGARVVDRLTYGVERHWYDRTPPPPVLLATVWQEG